MATQTATLPIQIGVNALSGGNGAEDRTIVDFVTLLTRLCSDEGFQTLRGLFEKNEALAKEVKDQGIANEKNFETIARIKQESADLSQRLQQATEEGESLSKQLAEAQSDNEQKATELQSTNEEVQRLSKQIEENNASIQELSETKSSQEEEIERQNDDIASLQRSLKQLRSFTLDMKSLEDSEPEMYVFSPFPLHLAWPCLSCFNPFCGRPLTEACTQQCITEVPLHGCLQAYGGLASPGSTRGDT